MPDHVPARVRPLPFLYESTGVETRFTNRLDPEPRSRPVVAFHRPEAALEWSMAAPVAITSAPSSGRMIAQPAPGYDARLPTTVRGRLRAMPPIAETGLWPAQLTAVRKQIVEIKQRFEQTIDTVSKDEVLDAGFSEAARDRARSLVTSFEAFIAEHRDEITALQLLYSRPYAQRLRFADVKRWRRRSNRHPAPGRRNYSGAPTKRSTSRRSAAPAASS